MPSSVMCHFVAVKTDVSEERVAFVFKGARIRELWTTLAGRWSVPQKRRF
jgi:hypothetical protein